MYLRVGLPRQLTGKEVEQLVGDAVQVKRATHLFPAGLAKAAGKLPVVEETAQSIGQRDFVLLQIPALYSQIGALDGDLAIPPEPSNRQLISAQT